MECCKCQCYLHESDPHCTDKNNDAYCWECSYIHALINESKFLQLCGVYLNNTHAEIINGKVNIYVGKKRTPKTDRRQTPEYLAWRKSVYERDKYTCQSCSQVGGNLNAHHIIHYKDNKDLAYEISNGITLCEKCHKAKHKQRKIKKT